MPMKTPLHAALAGLALAAGAVAVSSSVPAPSAAPPPAVAAPDAVWDVLVARPFRLAEPYTHWWRSERPQVTAGHLLVLAVDPARFVPRETAEPVLMVGEQTAERINHGAGDGALVVLVPDTPGEDGWPMRDLATTPIFLGDPELPERVDAAWLAGQLASTTAIPFDAARIRRATDSSLDLRDRDELERLAAQLILAYAPSERDRANGLLVPRDR